MATKKSPNVSPIPEDTSGLRRAVDALNTVEAGKRAVAGDANIGKALLNDLQQQKMAAATTEPGATEPARISDQPVRRVGGAE